MLEAEAVEAALTPKAKDRLTHLDELEQDAVGIHLDTYRPQRRTVLGAAGVLAMLAVVSPSRLVRELRQRLSPAPARAATAGGRVHVVESSPETVRLGVIDSTLPNILEVDPGDVVVYPRTWSHFLNRLQPGVTVEQLAQWRRENPGRGPHSIIGPVGVRRARPGDMVSVRFLRLVPEDWGANFNNPGDLRTGALWQEFPEGRVRYLAIDHERRVARFNDSISLPIGPFQGTFGVAAPEDREVVGRLGPGVVSSVPPGQHAGNLDLRELTEGSVLYIPVWQAGAKLYTGDSHALQGDGEVNLTALETAMREVRIQVQLHEQPGWEWPFAETDTHWIAIGTHRDLNEAFRIALRNAIQFLVRRAGLQPLDAYSLVSLAVNFRITQVVDITQGVHAMIPKEIFEPSLRASIRIA
ncbi:MAG TPA: acetamidase/formamidase family protein [Limnochordales bacterium]